MRSLHAKFFVVIVGLVLSVGTLAFFVQARTIQYFARAMTQALGEGLAQRIVAEYVRPTPDSAVDLSTVKNAFSKVMAVNPNIELYLLDKDGKILAFTVPARDVVRDRVGLQPVTDFVSHRFVFPVMGDDPRDRDRTKVFSAALLDPNRPSDGYLYVILAGAAYDAAANRLQSGILLRSAFIVVGTGLAIALVAAFFVLMTMTRRLRLLAEAMTAFRESGFRTPAPVHVRSGSNTDELDHLAQTYNAMVAHIQAQMKEIEESNALRRDLVAGVSHDLRTPLASLRGYLETLIMKNESLSPQDRRMYLEVASAQSDRMNRLVEELFELAKLEDVEIRIELEPFQLSELVQDVVQKFDLVARDKGVTLAGQFTPDAPLVAGNIPLIERLLDNLLENAIRHTRPGGRIDVSVRSNERGPTLQVSDTGSGISEGDIPHVFDRFYRGDESRSSESGGAGLGLAIAKRIVDLHDGRISVSSKIGVGSTFLVELRSRPH